jgi:antitoxin component YwqK of YwqJK toxin-antitoxin module
MAIEVYKTATFNKKPVVVTLEFLPDTIAVSHGINAGRGNKFLVKKIENTLLTESFNIAYSRYCIEDGFRPLAYRVGQVIKAPKFDTDLSIQMSDGIHFVNDKKIAMSQEYLYWFNLDFLNDKNISLPDGDYTNYGNSFKKYAQYTIKNRRFHENYYLYNLDGKVREHAVFDLGVLKEYTCNNKTIKNGITKYFADGECWKYVDSNIDEEWRVYRGIKQYRHKNKHVYYFDLENIESVRHYNKDNQLHGEFIKYFRNGNISAKSQYENGKLIGRAITYHENGNEQFIIDFIEEKSIWRSFTSLFKKNKYQDCYVQEFDEDGNFVRYYSVIDDIETELDESMTHLKND